MSNQIKQRLSRIDRGLILVVLLCLIAAWPFLLRPSLPRETDTELHVFRAAELGYSIRGFEFYPRWAPDFYYGYGYPIFNYYAPLTYYLANLLSLAIPGGAVFGVKAVYVLGFLGAGIGMYKLGTLDNNSSGGLIGASCYLFAPYVYLIDPHLRGDLAEFFSLGLAPLMFWLYAVHLRSASRRTTIWSSVIIAAIILTHNLLGLLFFALLAGYSVWRMASSRQRNLRTTGWSLLPLGLAIGLSAFFWIPVAFESGDVQLANLIGPGHFDYRNHFLSLKELLSPSIPLDLGAVNPEFRFNLGLAQWLIGLGGLATIVWELFRPNRIDGKRRFDHLFWVLIFAGMLFMMTAASEIIWDTVPGLPFIQFPWRLLGPVALTLAVIGSRAARLIPDTGRFAASLLALVVALPILSLLPTFEPPYWERFGPVDQKAMLDFELHGLALGTTSTGDFVPATVDVVPGPSQTVVNSYSANGPIDRVNRQTLPPTAEVAILRQAPTRDLFEISSPERFVLRLYRFAFPGWRAELDGSPIPIEVAHPEGFIAIPIPAGTHQLKVWLGLTPVRTIASLASLISAVLLIVVVRTLPNSTVTVTNDLPRNLASPIIGWIAVALILALLGHFSRIFQPHRSGYESAADHQIHAYLQGGIDLLGYDSPTVPIQPGGSFQLTLYWKAREPVQANYQVFSHITTIPEHTWGQSDKLNPGDYPTSRWPLDRYVRDPHQITIPLGTPPGSYAVRIGLWNRDTGIRQLVLQSDGTVLGDSVELPIRVTVAPPSEQPPVAQLPILISANKEIAPGINLIGIDLDPGEKFELQEGLLTIILFWQASRSELSKTEFELRLVDNQGHTVRTSSGGPSDGLHPTNEWFSGEIIRDVRTFWVDGSVPTGEYSLEIRTSDTQSWSRIGVIQRTAP